MTFGVSQVSAVSENQLKKISGDLQDYMNQVMVDKNLDMVFVMLTNILEQRSDVIFAGQKAENVMRMAFPGKEEKEGLYGLAGVVSRKKQMIPKIIEGIQQL